MSKVGAICNKYETPCAVEKYAITIGLVEEHLEETMKDKKTNGILSVIDRFVIICYYFLSAFYILRCTLHCNQLESQPENIAKVMIVSSPVEKAGWTKIFMEI